MCRPLRMRLHSFRLRRLRQEVFLHEPVDFVPSEVVILDRLDAFPQFRALELCGTRIHASIVHCAAN